ncbi:histone deacetylase family protein [Desulfoferrobacter suflitae]|uniref:histone deacetylase family protein n=1 Tax=Desulfoferrobacter suflitae TaxID=2865782 RepID=UPI002164CC7D|nr:histone deacetylase family protein [Desulfoferrobacter suflitae]MCK8601498.1 histone deacetylase [Desulfoferrobacter suflitae]
MLKIIYHEDYLTDYFTSLAENPLRISIIYNKLKDYYATVEPEKASKESILRVHSQEHLEKVQQESMETYQTAMLAAGGALCSAHLACQGQPSFAIIRPPGHHAGRSRYGGFCFFNNIAVAVAELLETGLIRKAVIVDIDMHRGDGTQDIFAETSSVCVIDVWSRQREAYLELLQDELDRVEEADIIAVSAGFDLYVEDWGGLLESSDFHRIGCAIHETAHAKARGRYFSLLEGGYFLNDLGKNVLAFCQGLEGKKGESDAV